MVPPWPSTRSTTGKLRRTRRSSDASAPAARMSRSPLVSVPRRTLPTVAMSAAGASAFRYATMRLGQLRWRATAGAGRRWRCRSSIACRISCSFLRAHALDASNAAGLRRLGEIVEALDPQLLVEHRDGLRPDALQPQHVEQRRRKLGQQLLADARSRRSARFRECGRRGPCRCRSTRAGRLRRGRTPASAACATMSAALR